MKTLVVVPAFNESETIVAVIKDLWVHGYKNIVVVDDGSSDNTGDLAAKQQALVLTHAINRGLGAALGTGFAYAKKIRADILVTFDSDGQHKASDIRKVLSPIVKNKADVVIGSRLSGDSRQMPKDRKLINYLSNLSTFLLYHVWSTDTLSGLRAFNAKAVNCINIRTDRMEVSNEFFNEIHTHKLRFAEVPIKAIYTDYSLASSSQGNLILASAKLAFRMILRLFN